MIVDMFKLCLGVCFRVLNQIGTNTVFNFIDSQQLNAERLQPQQFEFILYNRGIQNKPTCIQPN